MKLALLALALASCDQGPVLQPFSFDQFVPKVHVVTPPPAPQARKSAEPRHIERRDPEAADVPEPPSVEPKAYAAWLAALSARDQQKVAKLCRKHPLDFLTACGGIGPLHIPLPPQDTLMARRGDDDGLKSLYVSTEAWDKSLTRAQHRYIDRNCDHHGHEYWNSSDLCGQGPTPLVVAFDDQPVQFATDAHAFAFAGAAITTDWPTAATPWIALDRDGDGAITSGAELFGSGTMLADGTHATNGFIALAALDANHDGRIDAADPAFAQLVLWADTNGDRRSTPDELRPLASVIDAISLADHLDSRCDTRGNCEGERAKLRWHDAAGAHAGTVVDVYLPTR